MDIQWYPGHMTKAKRMMQEDIRLVDLVIELIDARAPLSSKNPDIDEIAGGKSRLILLSKADLSDPLVTDDWMEYFEGKGLFACRMDMRSSKDVRAIDDAVKKACAAKIERDRKRGIKNRPVRAMVCGIPNVGKSTFINSYARKAAAKTGNKPGVTKGKQWIRLGANLELLDTPGILWPKFEDKLTGLHLAFIGSIKAEITEERQLAEALFYELKETYPDAVMNFYGAEKEDIAADKFYGTDGTGEAACALMEIARLRGLVKSGGEPDYDRACRMLLDDFRAGKIGKISLERPR